MKQMPSLQELSVEDAFVEDSLLCLPKLRIATLKELSCSSISIRIPWFWHFFSYYEEFYTWRYKCS